MVAAAQIVPYWLTFIPDASLVTSGVVSRLFKTNKSTHWDAFVERWKTKERKRYLRTKLDSFLSLHSISRLPLPPPQLAGSSCSTTQHFEGGTVRAILEFTQI